MFKTIVSITPLALDKDSRTLKMAASFTRLGHRSIVVEKQKSLENFDNLGIEIVSLKEKTRDINNLNYSIDYNHNYIVKALKFIWHTLRKMGFGFINDRISFFEFKKNFNTKYKLDNTKIPDADIYVFHSYEFSHFALSLKKSAKIIYDAHDFYQEVNPLNDESTLVKDWIMPFRWQLEKKLIKCSDVFLTVSNGLQEKYLQASGKIPVVIKNSHDFRNDTTYEVDIRNHLGLEENIPIVCCVGNKKKGMIFHQLINVFSNTFTNMHLAFVGNGYDHSDKSFKNIHFIPAVKPNKLVPFLRSANFGIVPYFCLTDNYKYSLPNGFFQLIAAQIPLIFFHDLVEIKKLNQDYNFGIAANIENENSLVLAVEAIQKNYIKIKENVINASQKLSWQEEENKLMKIVDSFRVI